MTNSLVTLTTTGNWTELLQPPGRADLEAALTAYIQPRRWFGGKARGMDAVQLIDSVPIAYGGKQAVVALARVAYGEGLPDTYVLPLAFAAGAGAEELARDVPHAIIARVERASGEHGVLYDALMEPGFCAALLELIAGGERRAGEVGAIQASPTSAFARLRGAEAVLAPKIVTAEQSNSSIIFGDRLIMKLFRRLEPGLNPDLEIGRFLTERCGFAHAPPAAGGLEYHAPNADPSSLAFLQGFVPNQGDAWHYTLKELADSCLAMLKSPAEQLPDSASTPVEPLLASIKREPPPAARAFIGTYFDSARLLGRRTAELHIALASDTADPSFAPEPFLAADQRAIYDSMHARASIAFATLRQVLGGSLPQAASATAEQVLSLETQVFGRYQMLLDHAFGGMRTRVHGDYHLGQILYTGADFLIIDFEGEPARPLSERRRKGSPLQDVAGMLRSFHYAPYAVLLGQAPGVSFDEAEIARLEPWARLWHRWVSAAFLQSYLATVGEAPFLPGDRNELEQLLDAYLLDKAIYELNYELNNRPLWVQIPVEGILQLIEAE
ncbi:MAG TPA: putative maltokinase [Roseiflexaceae bacterium]|nr:putative maltokinase [Roseiflexaceae bacterium]